MEMAMEKLGEVLKNKYKHFPKRDNVNNDNKDVSNNVDNGNDNNVSSNLDNVINVDDINKEDLIELFSKKFIDEQEKEKWLVKQLVEKLNDKKNSNYYKSLVKKHSPSFLLECLSITLDAQRNIKIKTIPAKYFVGVVKRRESQK